MFRKSPIYLIYSLLVVLGLATAAHRGWSPVHQLFTNTGKSGGLRTPGSTHK